MPIPTDLDTTAIVFLYLILIIAAALVAVVWWERHRSRPAGGELPGQATTARQENVAGWLAAADHFVRPVPAGGASEIIFRCDCCGHTTRETVTAFTAEWVCGQCRALLAAGSAS